MKTFTHTDTRHSALDKHRLGDSYKCACGYFATKRTEAEMHAHLDRQFAAEEQAIARSESRNA